MSLWQLLGQEPAVEPSFYDTATHWMMDHLMVMFAFAAAMIATTALRLLWKRWASMASPTKKLAPPATDFPSKKLVRPATVQLEVASPTKKLAPPATDFPSKKLVRPATVQLEVASPTKKLAPPATDVQLEEVKEFCAGILPDGTRCNRPIFRTQETRCFLCGQDFGPEKAQA